MARACATSIQSFTDAANAIQLGLSDIVIAGGTESMSDPPVFASRPLAHALLSASRAKTFSDKVRPFQKLKAKDLVPVPPAIAEYSTGLTMGESAEKMAKENHISRKEQDEIALASHRNAARAWKEGHFKDQVMHVPVPRRPTSKRSDKDNIIREDSTLEALSALKPVFDRKYGSVTAGNASPLTDGASALLVMSEERAKALGYEPLGFLKAYAYAATDPADQLLQGPAYAAPVALERAGMTLQDIDLFEMHEGLRVASGLQPASLRVRGVCKEGRPFGAAGRGRSLPAQRQRRLDCAGPSVRGATGARILAQGLHELKRRNKNTLLCTVCAQGGLGAAVVLERA